MAGVTTMATYISLRIKTIEKDGSDFVSTNKSNERRKAESNQKKREMIQWHDEAEVQKLSYEREREKKTKKMQASRMDGRRAEEEN